MGVLDGKVAIITGAGHGIGRGHALEFAKEGARLVLNDLGSSVHGEGSSASAAEEVVALMQERHPGTEAVANHEDVSDFDGAARLVQQAVDTYGSLDVVVNNAGIVRDGVIWKMSEADWDSVIGVHMKGTFCVTRHAAAYWYAKYKENGRPVGARLINTVSGAGMEGNFGQANYTAAKGGIASFTITCSLELYRAGVTCNCISPGGATRIMATMGSGTEAKEPEDFDGYDPLDPSNASPVVAWLASDAAAHVTGQVIRAVGDSIVRYVPWDYGGQIDNGGLRWEAAKIGPLADAHIFHSRHPGLRTM